MGWWERLKRTVSDEADEVKSSVDDLSARLDADMAGREADLAATPEQKLDGILDEIQANDSEFDQIRAKSTGEES